MTDAKDILEFVELSVKYGRDPSMVQGAGGNTSVKLADGKMVVKASGGKLKEISAMSGWVKVPTQVMRDLISSGPDCSRFEQKSDDDLVVKIDAATERLWPGAQKASIEASMHGLFEKFVVHLHPVELNTILTSKNGRELLQKILGSKDFLWIDMVPPGYYLGRAIYEGVGGQIEKLPSLVFLASHGVIAHGSTAKKVHQLLDQLTTRVKTWLDNALPSRKSFDPKMNWQSEMSLPEIFPDTVVFRKQAQDIANLPPEKALAIAETYAASAFMREHHKHLGLTAELLPASVCDYILGMSREKHRQQMYSKT